MDDDFHAWAKGIAWDIQVDYATWLFNLDLYPRIKQILSELWEYGEVLIEDGETEEHPEIEAMLHAGKGQMIMRYCRASKVIYEVNDAGDAVRIILVAPR